MKIYYSNLKHVSIPVESPAFNTPAITNDSWKSKNTIQFTGKSKTYWAMFKVESHKEA